MDTYNTKPSYLSAGMVAPTVAIILFILNQKYGLVVPVDIAGYSVDLITSLIPVLWAVGIWGRKRAKALITWL